MEEKARLRANEIAKKIEFIERKIVSLAAGLQWVHCEGGGEVKIPEADKKWLQVLLLDRYNKQLADLEEKYKVL